MRHLRYVLLGVVALVALGTTGVLWNTPGGAAVDSDGDGYDDATEAYLGTDPLPDCPATSANDDELVDAWPPDFTDNQLVNTLDLAKYVPHEGLTVPPAPSRFDLNEDGLISVPDLAQFAPP